MARFSGDKLHAIREQNELSLRALAAELDTTAMALSRYENGSREPGLHMIEKLSSYFRVEIDYFITKEEMRMNERYQLNLEKEVAAEFANNVVNRLMRYMIKSGISAEDPADPIAVLFKELWETAKSIIPHLSSVSEVKDYESYLKHIYRYIKKLESTAEGMVA
ncbi:MAG: helix-turn-helix domain-containing protein [Clostridiales Family XIII bacterium]|jgi:transcriptional regulator with XRE-family HTH domain|nr:helix-turn-helix domain-containing protein [Clostridiales Family XIII bacterium]